MSRRRKAVLKKSLGKRTGTQQNRHFVSSKSAKRRTISKRRRKNRLILIISTTAIVVAAAVFFIFRSGVFESAPDHITFTVAWNPGSTADDIVREISRTTEAQVTIQNITGANGANGANTAFQSGRNGDMLLSTSLSALVTAEAMGFSENSHNDWTAWLCAFSPAVVVVASDSPYHSMDDLIAAIRQNPGRIRCANSGFGTISFTAAELLSTRVVLEFDYISYSGSNQAVEALESSESQETEADFAVLLSIEATEYIRTGQVRAIGAFTEVEFYMQSGDSLISIPAIRGVDSRLDASLPFGEYFGLFIPSDTPQSKLHGLDSFIRDAVGTEWFYDFTRNAGFEVLTPDRSKSAEITEHFSSIINWTLYDVGYLPTNPETLGISRP